jgi:hypothetical protein
MRGSSLSLVLVTMLAVGAYARCNCDPSDEGDDAGTDGGDDGGGGDVDGGGDGGDVGPSVCTPVDCGGTNYACGNCLDDDNDGLMDDKDPGCLGPCHNREDSFLWGCAPCDQGGGGQCERDCYYDGNASVASTDGCQYNLKCDIRTPDDNCPYTPNLIGGNNSCPATQSDPRCYSVCRDQLTPNGCDCWGCCSVTNSAGTFEIYLRSETINGGTPCTIETANDPNICKPCTKNPSCEKGCGECQLCLGKTTLPDHCTTTEQCPSGEQACGLPGQPDCPEGAFCLTGCCKFVSIN